MDNKLLEKMQCGRCGGSGIDLPGIDERQSQMIPKADLICRTCGHVIPVRDGIVDTSPPEDDRREQWDRVYTATSEAYSSFFTSNLEKGFRRRELLMSYYPIVRVMSRLSTPLGSSLEIGSGSGTYSLLLKKLGLVREVTLLDYSLEALKAADRLFTHFGENCDLVLSEFGTAPFKKDAFDLTLSGGVIEHYPSDSERLSCLEAHLRYAELAFIQAPVNSICYWFQRALITAIRRGWPFGYEKPVAGGEFKRLASLAGAEVMDMDFQYFGSILVFSMPWLVRSKGIRKRGRAAESVKTDVAVLIRRCPDSTTLSGEQGAL